jgi:hypothetical protein
MTTKVDANLEAPLFTTGYVQVIRKYRAKSGKKRKFELPIFTRVHEEGCPCLLGSSIQTAIHPYFNLYIPGMMRQSCSKTFEDFSWSFFLFFSTVFAPDSLTSSFW